MHRHSRDARSTVQNGKGESAIIMDKASQMEQAINQYFNQTIKESKKLDNGWKETYLLILSNEQKVVFRSCPEYTKVFEREKFFYDTVNADLENICPNVLVIDGSKKYYERPFQIAEYIDGISLRKLLETTTSDTEKRRLYYQLGQTVAKINQIKINKEHPYITERTSWEEHFAYKLLGMQLNRIVKNQLVSHDEVDILCNRMKNAKAANTLSFVHRDIRPDNIIYKDGVMYVIDAETCEFGDPLNDLARIFLEWTYWEMLDEVLNGYQSIHNIDINNDLFFLYQLEILAEILDMHCNHGCKNIHTPHFLELFNDIKKKLL